MGKGSRRKTRWAGDRRRKHKNRNREGKLVPIREVCRAKKPDSDLRMAFLPLDQVKGLPAEAKRFLNNHAFYKARFNSDSRAFEATNEAGTMVIRGGNSPLEWRKV